MGAARAKDDRGAKRRGRQMRLLVAAALVWALADPHLSVTEPAGAALDPAVAGRQEVLACEAPYRFIHGSMLPNGRALLTAGSGANPDLTDRNEWFSATTVPGTCEYKAIRLPYDAFCGIQNLLPDGDVLSSGGNLAYPTETQGYAGEAGASVFDWQTETWGPRSTMPGAYGGRWYPTGTNLSDGKVFVVAGLDQRARPNKTAVQYDPATGRWSAKPYSLEWPLYPKNFSFGGGSVFFSGSRFGSYQMTPRLVDIETGAQRAVPGLRDIANRNQSAALVLFPAQAKRIMVMGGGHQKNHTVTNLVDVVDLRAPSPKFVPAASMPVAAGQIVAANLPDGTVYAAGGAKVMSRIPVQWAGLYDPVTNRWRQAAVPSVGRGYHTFAMLNDAGDVVVYSTNNQGVRFDRRVEVYHPPYRFRANRPAFATLPRRMGRGKAAVVSTTSIRPIRTVVLDHPSAITHTSDVDQRMIDVPFTQVGTTLTLQVPHDPGLVPPGWYRLWLVDDTGAVSQARWTQVG